MRLLNINGLSHQPWMPPASDFGQLQDNLRVGKDHASYLLALIAPLLISRNRRGRLGLQLGPGGCARPGTVEREGTKDRPRDQIIQEICSRRHGDELKYRLTGKQKAIVNSVSRTFPHSVSHV